MLAIAGGKGGTGKTTTALALARAFATNRGEATTGHSNGSAVIVVDADVDMPDLHAMAGVPREPTVATRARGRRVPGVPGVRVAPAPLPTSATSDDCRHDARSIVAGALRGLRRDRDELVLVDTPCGAGPDATTPLDVGDAAVLVTRPTPPAVRDTLKTAAMARALDTPVVGCAVVGPQPSRPLTGVFGIDHVVTVPRVDGDPLASDAVRAAIGQLAMDCTARQTPF